MTQFRARRITNEFASEVGLFDICLVSSSLEFDCMKAILSQVNEISLFARAVKACIDAVQDNDGISLIEDKSGFNSTLLLLRLTTERDLKVDIEVCGIDHVRLVQPSGIAFTAFEQCPPTFNSIQEVLEFVEEHETNYEDVLRQMCLLRTNLQCSVEWCAEQGLLQLFNLKYRSPNNVLELRIDPLEPRAVPSSATVRTVNLTGCVEVKLNLAEWVEDADMWVNVQEILDLDI